jgi:signal transduction histidine kinase
LPLKRESQPCLPARPQRRECPSYAFLFLWVLSAFSCFGETAATIGGAAGITEASEAYNRPWQINSYATEAGLTHQRVFDIAFESDGTAWLACGDGLRRYDGFAWKHFNTNSGLPSSFVRAVCVTRAGELWVGSDAGAGVFDYITKRYNTRGSERGLAGPYIRAIEEDPDGSVVFCCDQWPDTSIGKGGLTFFRQGFWETFRKPEGLPVDYVLHYFRDSSGRKFATTPRGWVQWNGNAWGPPKNSGFELEETILHMAEGRDHSLFAQGENRLLRLHEGRWEDQGNSTLVVGATREGEVISVSRDRGRSAFGFDVWNGKKFARQSAAFASPPQTRLYKVKQSPDGSIWCVGYGTVTRWEYRTGSWRVFPDLPPPRFADKAGSVWFSDAGTVVARRDKIFQTLPGLQSLLAVDRGGNGYAASTDGKLFRIPYAPSLRAEIASWGGEKIRRVIEDAGGVVWAAGETRDGNSAVSHLENGVWKPILDPDLRGRTVRSISPDEKSGVWLVMQAAQAVDYRLAHAVDDRLEWHQFTPRPPPMTYPTFTAGGGQYWLMSYLALYQRPGGESGDWRPVSGVPGSDFQQSLMGKNEVLFVFGGLGVSPPGCALFREGKWVVRHGDFNRGSLGWNGAEIFLSTMGGVYIRNRPGTLDTDFLPLPVNAFVSNVIQDQTGSLWIDSSEGVFNYVPSARSIETRIETSVTSVEKNAPLPFVFGGMQRFATHNPPEAYRYSWRIDKAEWSSYTPWPGRTLPAPDLSAGHHRIEVRARDSDGNVDATAAALEFSVLPVPLQQRLWFAPVAACLAGLIVLLAWIGVSRTREIARSNAALLKEIATRRRTESELEAARESLEQRVAQRTAELSRSNQSLNQEILERKQAEESQRRLEEQLRHVQKMEAIGTLAGGIAHDFNNILAIIIPNVFLALNDASRHPHIVNRLQQIMAASNRAKDLVQQILAFSRRQKRQWRVISLQPVVEEVLHLVRSALPATMRMVTEIEPNVPPSLADPSQIHQVLMNLCANAEYAMRHRQGELHVGLKSARVADAAASEHIGLPIGDYLLITVRDTGAGMTAETRKRIFEPFFTTKPTGEGTGLGLAVVHGIVKDHGGTILVTSEVNVGTEFQVYLPTVPAGSVTLQPTPVALHEKPPSHLRIMLVDDEPEICNAMSALLRRSGFQVTTYTNPETALEAFRGNPEAFDLVFTDLSMPEMSGIDLTKQLLEIRQLPVILATGFGGDWSGESALAVGIRKVLHKPLDPRTLRDQIEQVLRSN